MKIKDKIALAEFKLFKTINFDIELTLPNDYSIVYSYILYPDNEPELMKNALRISNDHFYTYSPLVFKPPVIAICSVIFASKVLSLPSIYEKGFRHIEKMRRFHQDGLDEDTFNRNLLSYENSNTDNSKHKDLEYTNFDNLPWYNKLHPFLTIHEITVCLSYITEYYEDVKNQHLKYNSKSKNKPQ